ncbi:lipopolysaccharide biosynthesis protein [Methylotenera sp.]|uniref:lipopolysaccharide biosynthesis protein n=1 Tax=Methylotenera sp. TaxID=2051956 RepID=UPI002723729E|nr:hypothetical protein [Methylotenera sp.]MDO9205533.1 hypothetical protein [Methylotenera sp.]
MAFIGTFKSIPSHWVALADQVLVSGVNFVIGVILARTFGVEVFGVYIIAITFLFYANTFQSSLVISPMMTAIPHETDEAKREELLSGFFGYALILIVLSVVGIAIVTYLLGVMVASLHLGANTGPLLLAIIGFQLQDWLRRALYALHQTSRVFLLDLLAYGGQLASLAILYYKNALTPSSALLSMAVVFFLSALLIITIQNIVPSFKQALLVIKTHWRGSRDFFVAWQLQWAGSQGLALFGGGVLGPQIVGALRASMNLVAPVNVLFQWMENVIPVRAVTHLKKGGLPEMYHFLSRLAWIGGVLFGVVVVGLYFFAEPLLGLIYGESYRPYALFVILQAVHIWLSHFYRLEFFACRATHRTADIARASLIMALVAIGTGVFGVYLIGGSAVILALILGQSVSHLYLFYRRKYI